MEEIQRVLVILSYTPNHVTSQIWLTHKQFALTEQDLRPYLTLLSVTVGSVRLVSIM